MLHALKSLLPQATTAAARTLTAAQRAFGSAAATDPSGNTTSPLSAVIKSALARHTSTLGLQDAQLITQALSKVAKTPHGIQYVPLEGALTTAGNKALNSIISEVSGRKSGVSIALSAPPRAEAAAKQFPTLIITEPTRSL